MNESIQSLFHLQNQFPLDEQLADKHPVYLITNPHSLCKNKIENLCDQVSSKRRKQFMQESKKINNVDSSVNIFYSKIHPMISIVPQIHRSEIDLNRNISMNTFHFFIFKYILSKYPEIILLDIHSYPKDTEWGGKKANNDTDLVILYPDNENTLIIIKLLQQYLEENNFSVVLIKGGENTLINYATAEGHLAMLLEFPDHGDDHRASNLIDHILIFLNNSSNP